MKHWVRFRHQDADWLLVRSGTSEIAVHSGNMYNGAQPSGEKLELTERPIAVADRADQGHCALE